MNIDERLEALTQSLELLTHDVRGLQDSVNTQRESISKLESTTRTIVESVAGLVRVAQIHDKRISRLEGTAD